MLTSLAAVGVSGAAFAAESIAYGLDGTRFSETATWEDARKPTSGETELGLKLLPKKDDLKFVNDLGFDLSAKEVLLDRIAESVNLLKSVTLCGQPIQLASNSENPVLKIGDTAASPAAGYTAYIYNDIHSLKGGNDGAQIYVEKGCKGIFEGDFIVEDTGANTTANCFSFAGEGTKVIRGTLDSRGRTLEENPKFLKGTNVIEGMLRTPGITVQNQATLKVVQGGKVYALSGRLHSFSDKTTLDIDGGLFDQRQWGQFTAFYGAAKVLVHNGGILRSGIAFHLAYGSGSDVLIKVFEGGKWYSVTAYSGFATGGSWCLDIEDGIAEFGNGLYTGYLAGNAATAYNRILLNEGGRLRVPQVSTRYDANNDSIDRPTYLYANGGELHVTSGDDSSAVSAAATAFVTGTPANFITVIREGGFTINTIRSDVNWNSPIRGNDNPDVNDGGLVKLGATTLTLSGACTYVGPNDVQCGKLVLNSANAAESTSIGGGATFTINRPDYYRGAIQCTDGGTLDLSAGGDFTMSSVWVDSNMIVKLTPGVSTLTVDGMVNVGGELLFEIPDTVTGTYKVLSSYSANEFWYRCRVLTPRQGKSYTFSLDGDDIKLTVGTKQYTSWLTDADAGWSDADNWDNGVPDGAGAQACLGDVLTGNRTLALGGDITLGSIYFSSIKGMYTIAGNTKTIDFATDDDSSPFISMSGRHYFEIQPKIRLSKSMMLESGESANGRFYTYAMVTSSVDTATLYLRSTHSSLQSAYFRNSVHMPVYANGFSVYPYATGMDFPKGLKLASGNLCVNYDTTLHGPVTMTKNAGLIFNADNRTITFDNPYGELSLFVSDRTHVGDVVVNKFDYVSSLFLDIVNLYYGGEDLGVMSPATLGIRGDTSSAIRTVIGRKPGAGGFIVNGNTLANSFFSSCLFALTFRSDDVDTLELDGQFTSYQDAGGTAIAADVAFENGRIEFGDTFNYCEAYEDTPGNLVTFGAEGKTTDLKFYGRAALSAKTIATAGTVNLDLTEGGRIKTDAFGFSGTIGVHEGEDRLCNFEVGTATFASSGTFDFGRTAASPVSRNTEIPLVKFDTLSQADEQNLLDNWTVTGHGYENGAAEIIVDRDSGLVKAKITAKLASMLIVR